LGAVLGSNLLSAMPALGEHGQVGLTPWDSIYLLHKNSSISRTEKSTATMTSLKAVRPIDTSIMVVINPINMWITVLNKQTKGKEGQHYTKECF